jgi:hypothetical protein
MTFRKLIKTIKNNETTLLNFLDMIISPILKMMVNLKQIQKHFHTQNKNTTQKLKDITSQNEIQSLSIH